MTTALILDPFYGRVDLGGFERLARERHGWNFNRLSFTESQRDPVAFFPILLAAVRRLTLLSRLLLVCVLRFRRRLL